MSFLTLREVFLELSSSSSSQRCSVNEPKKSIKPTLYET